MLDHDIIQTRGFRNIETSGEVTGFQFLVRMPNYRGLWASLIDGIAVTVDGEEFDHNVPRWSLGGTEYSIDELRESDGIRWNLEDAATITVPKPGGLAIGIHELSIAIRLRASYVPIEHQPSVYRSSRKATIVS